jgi:hypothetical protein
MPQPEPVSGHDSDAIYVNPDAVAAEGTGPTGKLVPPVGWAGADTVWFAGLWADGGRPPQPPDYARPLYLLHLTLLI